MKLYLGPCYGTQADFAAQETGLIPAECTPEQALSAPAVLGFQNITRTLLQRGESCTEYAGLLLQRNPDAVIVTEEIGYGIVPLDPFERRWREQTGRALCILAAAAERVVRVSCGIGQVIR